MAKGTKTHQRITGQALQREGGRRGMSRCKTAKKLLDIADEEAEKAAFTGYTTDFYDAYDDYINHIQDHGCWRDEL